MPGSPENLPPNLVAMFEDLFGQFLGGKLGANLSVDLALTDAEAASGLTRELAIQRLRACADCNGRGSRNPAIVPTDCVPCSATGNRQVTQGMFTVQRACATCNGVGKTVAEPCDSCKGSGRVPTSAMVSMVVPANAEHGQMLTLEGEGSLGDNGVLGVLYVYLLVGGRPDPRHAMYAAHQAAVASLPTAAIHRSPMPTWQVALIAVVALSLLAVLLLAL